MVYGYIRVSSKSQKDNNSFEQQEQEIKAKYENGMLQLTVPKEEPKKIASKSIAIE